LEADGAGAGGASAELEDGAGAALGEAVLLGAGAGLEESAELDVAAAELLVRVRKT